MRAMVRGAAVPLSTCALRSFCSVPFGAIAPTRRLLSDGTRYSKRGMDGFTDVKYNATADAFLERVEKALEEIDSSALEDVNLLGGVLTIETVARGTFVLNKQAPNVQIWLSSPLSGPHHYDMVVREGEGAEDTQWVADSDGHTLKEKMERELMEVLNVNVKF